VRHPLRLGEHVLRALERRAAVELLGGVDGERDGAGDAPLAVEQRLDGDVEGVADGVIEQA